MMTEKMASEPANRNQKSCVKLPWLLPTITAKINSLIARNSDVDNAYTKVSNSRLKRDKTLYAPETGLVEVAAEVKKYVLSLYGASSPEYKQIKGIAFKRNKK